MHTISQEIPTGRTRRTYSASFKAELIAQCRQVGVSCSAVAISRGMNPNVPRRWIKEADHPGDAAAQADKRIDGDVKPVPMPAPPPPVFNAALVNVRIDIERNGTTVSVLWLPLA